MAERLHPAARLVLASSLFLNSACSGPKGPSVDIIYRTQGNRIVIGLERDDGNGIIKTTELAIRDTGITLWEATTYQNQIGPKIIDLEGWGLFYNPSTGKWELFNTANTPSDY